MLMPKKTKYRKSHRGRRKGMSKGGTEVNFGDYGLQALETSYITGRQIEAARITITRTMQRKGKVWINIFPHKPITKKPAEVRMGSGKGAVEYYVAVVKPGRIIFEISGVTEDIAREAMRKAGHKLPINYQICNEAHMSINDLRELSIGELEDKVTELKKELMESRFSLATSQIEDTSIFKKIKKQIAQANTVLNQKKREEMMKAENNE